jgi:hypothetical protein
VAPITAAQCWFALSRLRAREELRSRLRLGAEQWRGRFPPEIIDVFGQNSASEEEGFNDGAIVPIRYPILFPDHSSRTSFLADGRAARLGATVSYRRTLNHFPEISGSLSAGGLEGATEVAARLLTLPLHPGVSERDREQILALAATCV